MDVIVKEQRDGFGSQFQNIISAIIFSDLNNMGYIHRPLKNIEHNYNNDSLFINKMNNLMNIDKKYKRLNLEQKKNIFKNLKGNYKKYFDEDIEKYLNSNALKNIKKSYMSNKKSREFYFPNSYNDFNVVIHLRNINSHDRQQYYKQMMNNYQLHTQIEQTLLIIKKLNTKFNNGTKKIVFHIISQGKIEEFQKIKDNYENIIFHLDDTTEISFHQMVIANVLVTNKSSYSYTAALLSDGIIYYKRFWHKGSKNWIHF